MCCVDVQVSKLANLHDMHRVIHAPMSPIGSSGPPRPLMDKVAAYNSWALSEHGHLHSSARTVVALSKFVSDLDCASYMLSNNQKLMIAMLLDGSRWRAHKQQIFKYENGA